MAGNAVDGVHNVFHSLPFERSHAVLGGAEGEEEWWEVEIGETEGWHVRAIDIWAPVRAQGLLQYPQTVSEPPLAPCVDRRQH